MTLGAKRNSSNGSTPKGGEVSIYFYFTGKFEIAGGFVHINFLVRVMTHNLPPHLWKMREVKVVNISHKVVIIIYSYFAGKL